MSSRGSRAGFGWGVGLGLAVLSLALSAPGARAFTAEELREHAAISGGDLLVYTPPAGRWPGSETKPLLAFAPRSAGDELAIALEVQEDGYYQVMANQLHAPHFKGAYRIQMDDTPFRLPIWSGWPQMLPRQRIWGEVRLRPGAHTLRITRDPEAAIFPLVLESIWLVPGRQNSWLTEAEWLLPGAEGEGLRPTLGWRGLSGYGELVFPARGPGETLTLPLPEAPEGATHLVVVLTGGPERGIAEVQVGEGEFSPPVDTYAATGGAAQKALVFPATAGAAGKLTLRCAGKAEAASGYALGVDGIAYGRDHVYEAEWLVWRGPWAGGPVLRDTGAQRASDRGYLGLTCNDPAQPVEIDLPVVRGGRYRLELRAAQDPSSGKLQAQLDDTLFPDLFDCHGERYIWPQEWRQVGEVELTPGEHRLRLWCRDEDPQRRVVRLDAIRLAPAQAN